MEILERRSPREGANQVTKAKSAATDLFGNSLQYSQQRCGQWALQSNCNLKNSGRLTDDNFNSSETGPPFLRFILIWPARRKPGNYLKCCIDPMQVSP